ncbi:hypothetical protein JCGZ_12883 [Jatropha curcas]|uniref:Uncharacterized protein n=1 Tax=Jatropha curcas TaxID=180498 RepID=A0A067KNF2_JATCU|nr:hypothetical protein JCGZ_12883 [Jatropha curcas]
MHKLFHRPVDVYTSPVDVYTSLQWLSLYPIPGKHRVIIEKHSILVMINDILIAIARNTEIISITGAIEARDTSRIDSIKKDSTLIAIENSFACAYVVYSHKFTKLHNELLKW